MIKPSTFGLETCSQTLACGWLIWIFAAYLTQVRSQTWHFIRIGVVVLCCSGTKPQGSYASWT